MTRTLLTAIFLTLLSQTAWNDAHKGKSPDLTPEQRNTARQALQDKGLVVVDNFMCWINSDLDDNVG